MENLEQKVCKPINPLITIKKHYILMLSVFAFILLITFISSIFQKDYYRAKFCISCNFQLSGPESNRIFQFKNSESHSISQTEMEIMTSNFMTLYQQDFPGLRKISLVSYKKERENDAVELVLEVYNKQSIDSIVNNYLKYLSSNSYLLEKLNNEKQRLIDLQTQLDAIIDAAGMGNANKNTKINKPALSPEYLGILEKRSEIKTRLLNLKGFEISVPPVTPANSARMPLEKKMILAVIWGAIFSLFVAFIVTCFVPDKNR